MMSYFSKMKGAGSSPARAKLDEIFWSWLGAFLGISGVAYCHYRMLAGTDAVMLVGSFGASAVLIYGAINSPLAQPRNLVGGHILSAIIGVTFFKLFPDTIWFASALAVATAIAAMQATKTVHPPGGATALIAVIGSAKIHNLGYMYAVAPVGVGALFLLVVALLVNNLSSKRTYPLYWR